MTSRLTIVIPTKNEEANIGTCLDAFLSSGLGFELIVVDNGSSDRTCEIAREKGAHVITQGHERCAQRNRGWREASGDFVMFVDADMIVPIETQREILERLSDSIDALYIPEIRVGSGLRIKARNFERSFYNATEIDGLRVIRRTLLEFVGGYDENLVACEDWDLDRRLLATGARTQLTSNALLHNESRQNLKRFLAKKAYYSVSVNTYRAKWGNDSICQRQFGLLSRYFCVFVREGGWLRLLRHPILTVAMYAERFAVGIVYLFNR